MATGSSENAKKFTKIEKSWILYDWANSVSVSYTHLDVYKRQALPSSVSQILYR